MKKRLFSCLLALAMAVGLALTLGGTARAEKPVIDTIIINNSSIEAPVIDSFARFPTYTVSPDLVRVNTGSCMWLPVEDSWPYLMDRIVTPGQYRFQYSLLVNQRDATLADQVKIIVDGHAAMVTPDPKPDSDGNVYITAYSQPYTARTLPSIPGSVSLDTADNPLKGGTTVTSVLSGGAEKLPPEILSYSWAHRNPGSKIDLNYSGDEDDQPAIFLSHEFVDYELRLRVFAEGYSGFLETEWRLVEEGASHTITVTDGTADKSTARGGEKVTLTASKHEDRIFDHWEVLSGTVSLKEKDPNASFSMPDSDVALKAVYTYGGSYLTECNVILTPPVAGERPQGAKADSPDYRVTSTVWTDTQTNTALSPTDVFRENTAYQVRIIVASNSLPVSSEVRGYVNGSDKNVTASPMGFALADLTTSLTASPGRANPFQDISPGDYFYSPVLWAYYHTPQITVGVDATHFGPARTVTRGQCVTFLWRAMGCPEPAITDNPFGDVSSGDYWYKAILWAVEKGITVGTDAAHFSPGQTLSTRHIVTFLYRTLNPGQGGPKGGWDGEAETWARQNDPSKTNLPFGVDIAISDSTPCPRADVVTFLYEALTQ